MMRREPITSKEVGFTPGPWLTQDERDGTWAVWTRQPHTGTLALVHNEDINGDYPAKSNADLIAAAPDLYDALDACRALALHVAELDHPIMAQSDRALAKARGEVA